MSKANFYKLANQKLLHEIEILDQNIHYLQIRTLTPPCITINGFDKLQIGQPLKHFSPQEIIQKLFILLNIPFCWIHSIENQNKARNYLPSIININLITDNIKVYVYNVLIKYLRNTNQKLISVKLLTH